EGPKGAVGPVAAVAAVGTTVLAVLAVGTTVLALLAVGPDRPDFGIVAIVSPRPVAPAGLLGPAGPLVVAFVRVVVVELVLVLVLLVPFVELGLDQVRRLLRR